MPAPVLALAFDGSDETCQKQLDKALAFAKERSIGTGAYDFNWHARYESTPVDAMDDLEADLIDAGFTVIRGPPPGSGEPGAGNWTLWEGM